MSCLSLLPLLLLLIGSGSAVIFRVGNGNCGGLGCDFGAFSLNEAINVTRDGDVIELYGQIFVSSDFPTPTGFSDTVLSITTSITIAGISDGLLTPSIQIVSPGTQGRNLFTLAASGIELADFPINREVVKNADNDPNVATVRIRNCFNGTCSPADNILLTNIVMQQDEPFLGSDVLIENGTYTGIRLLGGVFRAAIGVNINETAQLSDTRINENRFLFSSYNNNNPAAKPLSAVDLRMNFWRPCPYRGPGLITPPLGLDEQDTWRPYCVDSQCEIPGPIATVNGSGSYEGWLTIQDALMSSQPDPLTVAVTAPFFEINSTQIIFRRITLTSVVDSDCVVPCFANGTYPTVRIANNSGSTATIGFVILGRLLSANNLQFELQEGTRLAVYRRAQPYNATVFDANRGPLAFGSIAFTANAALQASLNTVLTTDYASMFPVSTGGDMTLTNLQIRGGRQGIHFWGPNMLSGIEPLAELLVEGCLFDGQVDFAMYMAGPNFQPRLESNYFGGSGTSYGLLAEKLNDIELFRTQIIEVGTGVAFSQVNSSLLDCNACVDASDFCISVQSSSGNVAKWNTFAVANGKRFSRMPDSSSTLAVDESISLGKVTPQLRVFQQFSSVNFPYLFAGPAMFTQSDDVLRRHNTSSMTDGTQNASSSLFLKSSYLPVVNLDCYNYRDSLSSVYSAYSNVRDSCSLHKLEWNPFDNSSLGCSAIVPIVQRIPDFEWQQMGSSMNSGADCILTSQNTTQNVRFAVGTVTMRNAFVCVACDGDLTPFANKTCDFMVGSFQQAMEQVRVSQLEDATILVNGVCFVFNEVIDVQGLTIENCGDATLSPTQGLLSQMKRDVMDSVAEYQLRITVNFTTIQGIVFQAIGDNTTYTNTYCVVFIDGEELPIFNTTLFNNSFLQPNVDHLCTLMDTFTNASNNRFKDSRVSVRMSADSNAVVPEVSGVNSYSENSFENGVIHMFYTFRAPIRRPTAPYSRLQVMDNSFMNPRDVSLDVLGISGRRTRMDLVFQRNEYTNPTPDSSACQPGNMDPTICCEDTKGCDTAAQRFVDSEDALFDNERYFGGAIMQMAGRNVLITNGRWRDKSAAVVGNSELALLQNPFSPKNITIDGANFAKDATIVCNLGRSFNPATGRDGMLMASNTVINGQNIGVSKDDCDQTLIGIFTANCVDRQGRQIFSARNTAPFEAREFIDPMTRVRTNCSGDLVYIPSQQGGTGTCNCEFLPTDQFIATVPFIPPITSAAAAAGGSMSLRNVEQQEMINSEVQNCPTGQIHNPSNRSECIEGTPTTTPKPTPTPTPTPEPPTPSPRSPSSPSSSDDSGLHHLWWLWVLIGAGVAIILIGIVIWAFVSWRRRDKAPLEQKKLMSKRAATQRQPTTTTTIRQQPQQVQMRRSQTNEFGQDSIIF